MRVEGLQGNLAYGRDTRRTLRSARCLEHITGRPAHADISSRQNDRPIAELVDGATRHWFQFSKAEIVRRPCRASSAVDF